MLPAIQFNVRIAFRHLKPEARDEAVAECLANALVAYTRLYALGKVELAYPTVLARYAVAQVKDGRKVGGQVNIRDVSSTYCQRRRRIDVERLDQFDEEENAWQEILVEDKHAGPAEIATIRMDFAAWLRALPCRLRKIAKLLANGESTNAVAQKFGVSAGRVSQLRKELRQAWQKYQGEQPSLTLA